MWNLHAALKRLTRRDPVAAADSLSGTVLIVDDEESIRRFAQHVLNGAGCRTVVASDGLEAIDLASRTPKISLALIDLMMPRMNGDELARRLRQTRPDIPILYLTGFSDRLFADRVQLWDHEAFLDKPCSVKGLLEAVSLVANVDLPGAFPQSGCCE